MPRRRNNSNNPFVRKHDAQGRSEDENQSRMHVESVPGDTGPGIVDQAETPTVQDRGSRFSDRIRYDEFGGVDKSTMRPKQKMQRI